MNYENQLNNLHVGPKFPFKPINVIIGRKCDLVHLAFH